MKKILLLFLFLNLVTKAQDFCLLYVGSHNDSSRVSKNIIEQAQLAKTKGMNDSTTFEKKGDTLYAFMFDDKYGVKYKFVFSNQDSSFKGSRCIYQEVTYDCSPCASEYLNTYIKFHKFRTISQNKFWSEPLWQIEMEVIQNGPNKSCLTLKFRPIDIQKEEYKRKYKILKKKKD